MLVGSASFVHVSTGAAALAGRCRAHWVAVAAASCPSRMRKVSPALRSRSMSTTPMAAAGGRAAEKSSMVTRRGNERGLLPTPRRRLRCASHTSKPAQRAPAARVCAPEAGVSTPPLTRSSRASSSCCCSAKHSAASSSCAARGRLNRWAGGHREGANWRAWHQQGKAGGQAASSPSCWCPSSRHRGAGRPPPPAGQPGRQRQSGELL